MSEPRKMFAVVCTGVITDVGLPCFLSKDGNKTYPVVLFLHESKDKCIKRKASLERQNRTINFFDAPGMTKGTPYLAVVPVVLPPRKEMSAEHKAKLAAAMEKRCAPAPTSATSAGKPGASAPKK